MSIQRPLGPIGHCSASLRRLLAIEEEEALGRTVRIRVRDRDGDERGNRWSRAANFHVPGAFHGRYVSADGRVTFHFEVAAISKTSDGGCRITTSKGNKRLAIGAPAEHDGYIERAGAVETAIAPASFDGYAARETATETIGETRAIFSNIAETAVERQRYWRAIHEYERTPGPDRVTLVPEKASRTAWLRLADKPGLPDPIRKIAAAFATAKGKRKTHTIDLAKLDLDRIKAGALIRDIHATLATGKNKHAVRLSIGRGGRSQYRLTAELPAGLDAAGRLSVMKDLCAEMAENRLMYVAALHAPDHHNDRRNYHLHIAFHDRPAKMIGDRWDFEIAEPVDGQYNRVRYPHRQPKVEGWSRDPDGGGHRAHGRQAIANMRTFFADLCNEQLDRLGIDRKFHAGDLKSLGCEREAQEKLGICAAPLEAAGVPTEIGIGNAERLWTALLREAWAEAGRRTEDRARLRRRLANAERDLMKQDDLTAIAMANQVRDLWARLDAADGAIGIHDAELAEYDVTLAMARARPAKVLDTCGRILAAIEAGKASTADRRASKAVTARAIEAEDFFAKVFAADREMQR